MKYIWGRHRKNGNIKNRDGDEGDEWVWMSL